MKFSAIAVAILLAASVAQAQEVIAVEKSPTETIELTSAPCPTSGDMKLAIHNSYGMEPGTSYGCWASDRGSFVAFTWHQVVNKLRAMPNRVPKIQFKKA